MWDASFRLLPILRGMRIRFRRAPAGRKPTARGSTRNLADSLRPRPTDHAPGRCRRGGGRATRGSRRAPVDHAAAVRPAGAPPGPALKEGPPAAAPAGGVAVAASAATAVAVAPPQAAPRPAVWPPPGAVPTEVLQRPNVAPLPPPKFRPDLVDVATPAALAAASAAGAAQAAVPTTRVSPRVRSILARRPDLTLTRVAIVALFGLLAFSAISNLVRTTAGSPKADASTAIGSPLVGGAPGSRGAPPGAQLPPDRADRVRDGVRRHRWGHHPGRHRWQRVSAALHRDRCARTRCVRSDAQALGRRGDRCQSRLVEGQDVYLEREVSDTDQFSRLLRNVWLIESKRVRHGEPRDGSWSPGQVSTFPPDERYGDDSRRAAGRRRRPGSGSLVPAASVSARSPPRPSGRRPPIPSVHDQVQPRVTRRTRRVCRTSPTSTAPRSGRWAPPRCRQGAR